jgi:hypothetical protein
MYSMPEYTFSGLLIEPICFVYFDIVKEKLNSHPPVDSLLFLYRWLEGGARNNLSKDRCCRARTPYLLITRLCSRVPTKVVKSGT